MANWKMPEPMRAGERALRQTLRDQRSDERERQRAEAETAEDTKIARLRQLRLAKEATEREGSSI